jgi:hypothetical protein
VLAAAQATLREDRRATELAERQHQGVVEQAAAPLPKTRRKLKSQ